jgi:putative oxidoreductase
MARTLHRHDREARNMDVGLLLLRGVIGLEVAAHGAQKLFGWFGGGGKAGTATFLETLGFRPGSVLASMAGCAELIGGLGLALGFLTPFAAALVMATMIVAIGSVHLGNGLFAVNGGYEDPMTIAAAAAAITFIGPGWLSLDHALGVPLSGARWGITAIVIAVCGALPPLFARVSPASRQADYEADR